MTFRNPSPPGHAPPVAGEAPQLEGDVASRTQPPFTFCGSTKASKPAHGAATLRPRTPGARNGRVSHHQPHSRHPVSLLSAPSMGAVTTREHLPPEPGQREPSDQPLVLLADAENVLVRVAQAELLAQGFQVVIADGGEHALSLADERLPSILVLGMRLPDVSGLDVMTEVHHHRNVPVILLSADDDGAEKVRALDLGADDFLVKPFSPEELSARVRAVLRRTHARKPELVVRMGDVEVDLERHTVKRRGAPIRLTRTEWMLLEHLIANAGHVLMNRDLLEKVWGPEYTSDLQYLRVWISRLRRKLEGDPSDPHFIKTYAGIGYMLDLNPGEAAQ